jgi:hypothetical protein
LTPDQRIAFVEMLTAKLNGHHEIGDGMLYQLCRNCSVSYFRRRLMSTKVASAAPENMDVERASCGEELGASPTAK